MQLFHYAIVFVGSILARAPIDAKADEQSREMAPAFSLQICLNTVRVLRKSQSRLQHPLRSGRLGALLKEGSHNLEFEMIGWQHLNSQRVGT